MEVRMVAVLQTRVQVRVRGILTLAVFGRYEAAQDRHSVGSLKVL